VVFFLNHIINRIKIICS